MIEIVEGIVIENHGALFDVLVGEVMLRCFLRGRLKKGKREKSGLIAAGDRVKVRPLDHGRGVVEEVLPRESDLSRKAAGAIPLQQTLAANVNQAVIVFAAAEPAPDFFMLDRFLVVTAVAGLDQIVCVNKCDLAQSNSLRERFAAYERIGYRVLLTSAIAGEGLDELRALLVDKRSVICGPSGVGKSSLLNALAPSLSLRVSEVGEVTHKGRHTTSSVALLSLPFGGWIADTPGLRQLAFWEVPPDLVAEAFPEFRRLLGRCRFQDCKHTSEPGCALRAACDDGRIDRRRLRSYRQMVGR